MPSFRERSRGKDFCICGPSNLIQIGYILTFFENTANDPSRFHIDYIHGDVPRCIGKSYDILMKRLPTSKTTLAVGIALFFLVMFIAAPSDPGGPHWDRNLSALWVLGAYVGIVVGLFRLGKAYLGLFSVFALVFLMNLDVLRVLTDDWCNIPVFQSLTASGWSGIKQILTNEWMGSPRVQFLSWLIQASFAHRFGFFMPPYFLFFLTVHFFSSLLVFRIIREVMGEEDVALAAALLYLVFPSSAGVLFYVKNWFLLLPVSLFLVFIYVYLFPLKRRWADLIVLSLVSLAGQFAGEGTIPLFYLAFLWMGIHSIRKRQTKPWAGDMLRAAVPFSLCSISLAWYVSSFVRGYVASQPVVSASVGGFQSISQFLGDFFILLLQAIYFKSRYYGDFSISASLGTMVSAGVLLAVLLLLFLHKKPPPQPPRVRFEFTILFLTLCLLAGLLPYLYGAWIGYRTAVENRYIVASGLMIAVMIPILIHSVFDRFWRGKFDFHRKSAYLVVTFYFGVLMVYNVREVWGTQKLIDDKLYGALDSNYDPGVKYIITDSYQHFLVPGGWSNAESEFHGGYWGITCRMRRVHGHGATVARAGYTDEDRDHVTLGYIHDRWRAKKTDILAIAFSYGPHFRGLRDGTVRCFREFEDYAHFWSGGTRIKAVRRISLEAFGDIKGLRTGAVIEATTGKGKFKGIVIAVNENDVVVEVDPPSKTFRRIWIHKSEYTGKLKIGKFFKAKDFEGKILGQIIAINEHDFVIKILSPERFSELTGGA